MHDQPDQIDLELAQSWMSECVELANEAAAAGNYALGALVVRDGTVLARSSSQLIDSYDPSAHPEMVTLRAAAERSACRYIVDAYLVTTLEPCVMCTGAAIWAKLRGIVFGAHQSDAVAWSRAHPDELYTWRQIHISCQEVVDKGEPRLAVVGGVLRDACAALFELNHPAS